MLRNDLRDATTSMMPHLSYACLLGYTALSLIIVIILQIDPLVDKPTGLVKLRWFTRTPLSHGQESCAWDYEGSWQIGLATGFPDPLNLSLSSEPVLTCANLANSPATSFVADPFLYIPDDRTAPQFATVASMGNAQSSTSGDGPIPWYAFYELKNLARYTGELGVAVSNDRGTTWHHIGIALSEPFHLSFPLVLYDNATSQYLMFAETSAAREGAIRVYGTSQEAFPFGWRLVLRRQPEDPGWRLTRRWFHFGAPAKYVDTAPAWFQDRWWIFTTRYGTPAAGQPKYTLLLYTADTLLGEWQAHPSNLLGTANKAVPGGRVPYGIDSDLRSARNGGRPFVFNGSLYRWAQDCSRYYGEALLLMQADVVNDTSYIERVVTRYEPRRDGISWNSERLHHADIQQLPDGSWVGLVDGDRYADGKAHFLAREQWFIELKELLGRMVLLQLVIVGMAIALRQGSGKLHRVRSWQLFAGNTGAGGCRRWHG